LSKPCDQRLWGHWSKIPTWQSLSTEVPCKRIRCVKDVSLENSQWRGSSYRHNLPRIIPTDWHWSIHQYHLVHHYLQLSKAKERLHLRHAQCLKRNNKAISNNNASYTCILVNRTWTYSSPCQELGHSLHHSTGQVHCSRVASWSNVGRPSREEKVRELAYKRLEKDTRNTPGNLHHYHNLHGTFHMDNLRLDCHQLLLTKGFHCTSSNFRLVCLLHCPSRGTSRNQGQPLFPGAQNICNPTRERKRNIWTSRMSC